MVTRSQDGGGDQIVDRAVPIPLYFQLAELIREQIRQGALEPGDRLPSERELSDRYQISRMTVRHALAYLEREAVVDVRHGSGSYVAEPKLTYDALQLMGFSEAIRERGGALTSVVLEQRRIGAPPSAAAALGLAASDDVVKIVRIREVEKVAMAIETNYLVARACPGLERVELSQDSLYGVLDREYGITLERVEQTFEAASTNDFERKVFGMPDGGTILLVEGTTFAAGGAAIEYFKSSHRGDRFKVRVEGRRGTRTARSARPQLRFVLDDADIGDVARAEAALASRVEGGDRC
jgi:GntR family transcriptional regulator